MLQLLRVMLLKHAETPLRTGMGAMACAAASGDVPMNLGRDSSSFLQQRVLFDGCGALF